MNWTELLKQEAEGTYRATEGLLDLVEDSTLGWKPASGENWMTVGQLLMHIDSSCGFCCRGFATGEWGLPEGMKMEDVPADEMLPPAVKMPTVESVAKAKELLAADKKLTFEMIDQAGEDDLANKKLAAPWNPGCEMSLGEHFLHMIGHLAVHKAQLFYYMKLQAKPVNTGTLWGM